MKLNEKIKELRKEKGITQLELSKALNVEKYIISNWEQGRSAPSAEDLTSLAVFFDISVDFLLGLEDDLGIITTNRLPTKDMIKSIGGFPLQDKYRIPVVGQVVAGKPIESSEYLEGYIYIDYKNPDEYFALRVNGDSMIGAGIVPNALLIVHKQNYAVNGDIIVASIDGESTVKRYRENAGVVFLMPENSAYSPILVTEKNSFYIFGKVVEIRQKL